MDVNYGYDRVWTDVQSVEGQVRQLTKAAHKKMFREVEVETRLAVLNFKNCSTSLNRVTF